jgi:hypothetical protein
LIKNRSFPPLGKQDLENHIKIGKRARTLKCAWGEMSIAMQRWEDIATKKQCTTPVDASLDSSDWTPWALQRLLDLAHRLPFEEGAMVASHFGLSITTAELERLSQQYSDTLEKVVSDTLIEKSTQVLEKDPEKPARVMVLELDGVRVKGKPKEGVCEGIELKTALIYSMNRPGERTRVAGVIKAQVFRDVIAGLLRQAGVRQQDEIIAVSDGAVWIADLLEEQGILQILDVFHAAEYFEKVLVAIGWDEKARKEERGLLLYGKIDVGDWLKEFLPRTLNGWDEETLTAVRYLQDRINLMKYPTYKSRGYPIGSGQIEGMNKHVIGSRMKRSGMQWLRKGASRMGAFRAECLSSRPVTRFEELRFKAFPPQRTRVTKIQANPQS